jgi:hypothetical protein
VWNSKGMGKLSVSPTDAVWLWPLRCSRVKQTKKKKKKQKSLCYDNEAGGRDGITDK